jgi:DNA mismatch endonuclease (patch repair protein)
MADTFTKRERSRIMAAVKSKHTTPELAVRRLVHSLGFRYRLHVRSLPGTPDLVFACLRKVIEVRGCFWHGHHCGRCRIPLTHRQYWVEKIERNRVRDRRAAAMLRRQGWNPLIVWECQLKDTKRLAKRIVTFLDTETR